MALLTTEKNTARKASIPQDVADPFSVEFSSAWLNGLADAGLVQGPVLVPSTAMAAEAVVLARRGFAVKLNAETSDAGKRAREEAKRAGVKFNAVFDGGMFDIKPWQLGSVSTIFDRTVLPSLELDERFAYANRVGRILPPGGRLIGVFRLGEDGGAVPRALPHDLFERYLFRYFSTEQFALAAPPAPGDDQAWCGVLRRK